MPGVPETNHDRATLCYATAYFVLPHYVFGEPQRVLKDFAERPDYSAKFFYVMACQVRDWEPSPDDLRQITAHSGMLNDDRSYHIIEYPPFPPVDITGRSGASGAPSADSFKAVRDAMRNVVLAPYFSAIIYGEQGIEHYLVLGQSPDGATTLRRVTPRINANLGRGCAPSLAAFVSLLRTTLSPGGSLPPAIAAVGRGDPSEPDAMPDAMPDMTEANRGTDEAEQKARKAGRKWWQFWRR